MSSVWVIEYIPTEETLPLIFRDKMAAFLELKILCDLYNNTTDSHELKEKKMLADMLFCNLNLLRADINNFNIKEIKKLTASKKLELYNKLQKMTIDAAIKPISNGDINE